MVNPKDVFPRRNLPDDAEEWGRNVETRIQGVEYAAINQKSSANSQNRTSASTLQSLARQIQRIEDLYAAIPKVAQTSATNTGFGLSGGWNTIVSASLTVPAGAANATILAFGSGLLVTTTTSSVVTSSSRVVIAGTAGPVSPNAWYPGTSDFRSILVPAGTRAFSVTPGATITVSVQANPDDSSAYPSNPSSYAVVSVIATFTG